MASDIPLSAADFGQLRAFATVARTLSFSGAARQLDVTPSALSQTIRHLEEALGVRLLNRSTRSVSLTAAGQALRDRVQPALAELGAAVAEARDRVDRPAGVLRLHGFRVAIQLLVTPMLQRFHAAYPEIVLDIEMDDHVVDIVAGGFDAALRVGEVVDPDLVAVPLGPPLRHVVVAAPSYLALRGTPATPQDLADHACINWRWPGHAQPYRWEFSRDGQACEVAVTGPLIANSRDLCVQAAVEGLGLAIAIEQVVAPHVASGALVPVLEDWSVPFPGFYLCWASGRQMAPALRAFIDAMR